MRPFTTCEPALVEPASQTSSAFAAASSEGMIISRRRPPTYELAPGTPSCSLEHGGRDRELQRGRGGEPRLRVPGSAAAGREALDEERGASALVPRACPGAGARASGSFASRRRTRGARRERQPVDVPHDAGRGLAPVASRRSSRGGSASPRGSSTREREPPAAQRLRGEDAPVRRDDEPAACRPPRAR